MGIPEKALKLSTIVLGDVVGDGSHEVRHATFIVNGKIQRGFYKKLEPQNGFPRILAGLSVSASIFLKFFQGAENTPQEYLVFDDSSDPQVSGIISAELPGFKPFKYAKEELTSLDNIEEVIPTTETLLKHNIIALLFGRWFLNDDDPHPHNLSLVGGIDFDMFWYWFAVYMKGPRAVIELPKPQINLNTANYASFPCIKAAPNITMPYHWATFVHPGQESIGTYLPESVQKPILSYALPKVYADPEQFIKLAASPKAQAQKVEAALKILMTYQPEKVKAELIKHFGEMRFNFSSLGPELQMHYRQLFPNLCYDESNQGPFVDFVMKLYQLHYDKLYSVVVFYMGCKDNGHGIPLEATHMELYSKPSFYHNLVKWMKKENEANALLENRDNPSTVPDKFDLETFDQRYHQIWRDSYAPRLKHLVYDSRKLLGELQERASRKSSSLTKPLNKFSTTDVDTTLTEAWELFPFNSISVNVDNLAVDSESNLNQSIVKLTNFTNELQRIITLYYKKERTQLTPAVNAQFVDSLKALCKTYEESMSDALMHKTQYADDFSFIIKNLKIISEQINFSEHLKATDEQIQRNKMRLEEKDLLPLTHSAVTKEYNVALFNWVDTLSESEFTRYLTEDVVKTYRSKSTRCAREIQVLAYLKNSNESNSNKLAYILSSGTNDEGAFNTSILEVFTPLMLENDSFPVNSVYQAYRAGTLAPYIPHFVSNAAAYAKTNPAFSHLYSEKGVEGVYSALFEWVDKVPRYRLNTIIDTALKSYEQNLSYLNPLKSFWGTESSKKNGIIRRFQLYENSAAHALAVTFEKGELQSTSSASLFRHIIEAIKAQAKDPNNAKFKDYPKLTDNQGYNLIALLQEEHFDYYVSRLKNHCVTKAWMPPQLLNEPASLAKSSIF